MTEQEGGRTRRSPLLDVRGLTKVFPGNRALDDVSLTVHSGEIVALVGHNGSGKSTLVKTLAGVYSPDAGTVTLGGDGSVQLHVIHQDLGLAGQLTAIENLGITRDRGRRMFAPFRRRAEHLRATRQLSRFGAPFPVDVPVERLAPAQRSIVAIARALDGWEHPRNLLILDEPTEALHAGEVRVLFQAVRRLAAEGAGIVFISHRLDEVLELADRVIVLRDGRKVADESVSAMGHDTLVRHITGDAAPDGSPSTSTRSAGDVVLSAQGLSGGAVADIDLQLRAGEVVGVSGVLGSGRESLPAVIFGALESTATSFEVAGAPYSSRSPRASIRRGIAYIPGDRARHGSVGSMSAAENVSLADLSAVTGSVWSLAFRRERASARELMSHFDVRPCLPDQRFNRFSGGNQQKIVFAKWIRTRPRLLLVEEPTHGVDVGAKQTIYDAIHAAAAEGSAVLVCSSDAKELARLCDRVLVLREGRISARLAGPDLTEENLILHGYGLTREDVAT